MFNFDSMAATQYIPKTPKEECVEYFIGHFGNFADNNIKKLIENYTYKELDSRYKKFIDENPERNNFKDKLDFYIQCQAKIRGEIEDMLNDIFSKIFDEEKCYDPTKKYIEEKSNKNDKIYKEWLKEREEK